MRVSYGSDRRTIGSYKPGQILDLAHSGLDTLSKELDSGDAPGDRREGVERRRASSGAFSTGSDPSKKRNAKHRIPSSAVQSFFVDVANIKGFIRVEIVGMRMFDTASVLATLEIPPLTFWTTFVWVKARAKVEEAVLIASEKMSRTTTLGSP